MPTRYFMSIWRRRLMAVGPSGPIGIPRLPIPHCYVKAALAIMLGASKSLRKRSIIKPGMREDVISKYLDGEMRVVRYQEGIEIVRWFCRPTMPDHSVNPPSEHVPDFVFYWNRYDSCDLDHYLVAEAKKLFGKGDSWAGRYVERGVLRLVSAGYAWGH